jgi:hypothetical protein
MTTAEEPPRDLKNALHHSASIANQRKTIAQLEKEIQTRTEIRDGARQADKDLEKEYRKLFDEFVRRRERRDGARDLLQYVKQQTDSKTEQFLGYVGEPSTGHHQYLKIACTRASELAAQELIAKGVKQAEAEFDETRSKLLDFAKGYGFPAELIEQIQLVR